tara:strand:- start:878 stop:1060 length:183 start_codon:yes stop_codon:yes gene_type:complete
MFGSINQPKKVTKILSHHPLQLFLPTFPSVITSFVKLGEGAFSPKSLPICNWNMGLSENE